MRVGMGRRISADCVIVRVRVGVGRSVAVARGIVGMRVGMGRKVSAACVIVRVRVGVGRSVAVARVFVGMHLGVRRKLGVSGVITGMRITARGVIRMAVLGFGAGHEAAPGFPWDWNRPEGPRIASITPR
jgi:hypothetical protein